MNGKPEIITALNQRLIEEHTAVQQYTIHRAIMQKYRPIKFRSNDFRRRPVNSRSEYTPKTDLAALAASYAFGLVKNHPFVDGNKRAGFLACNLFLELNGKRLEADIPEAITIVHALAEGTITEEQFASWLGQNIR